MHHQRISGFVEAHRSTVAEINERMIETAFVAEFGAGELVSGVLVGGAQ